MSAYGLLMVDTSWANQDHAEIDKVTFLHHQAALIAGTHALIYVGAPIDAVVAEAEISGDVFQTEGVSPNPPFDASIPANVDLESKLDQIPTQTEPPAAASDNRETANDYHVPLKVTRLKGQTPSISLARLQKLLGSDFSVFDETWIPLSKQQYRAISAEWEKEQIK